MSCSRPVIRLGELLCMLPPIEFDDEAQFNAGEIGEIRPYGVLSPKFKVQKLPAP